MRRLVCLAALACAAVALSGSPVLAWNKAGHMVSGALAFQVLQKDSPATAAKVAALLRQHPDFEKYWKKRVEADYVRDDERDLYLFMLAARWPDDVRGREQWYPPNQFLERWHYINIPFKPTGQPDTVEVGKPEDINILRGFEENLRRVSGAGKEADRAVALCWLLHLVGDVHQPLHTSTLYTTEFQEKEEGKVIGDRGGTRFYIRAEKDAKPIHLHKFWDDLIIGSEKFVDTRNRATELRNRADFQRDKLTELTVVDFEKWAVKESYPLAVEVGYRNGKLKGSPTMSAAPVLPEDYAKIAQPVGERRMILAGYRLAEVLKKAFE